MSQLVLSLFPGIGLLDMAFEQEGFCVVRGPDVLWGGDVRRFLPPSGKFDGVIGGPPCQAFSQLAKLVRHNGHQPKYGNLIPEFERCVADVQPRWFLMENVEGAPIPDVDGYTTWYKVFRDCDLGGMTMRRRRFSFGVPGDDGVDLKPKQFRSTLLPPERAVTGNSRVLTTGAMIRAKEHGGGPLPGQGKCTPIAEMKELQGLPADFLKHCPFKAEAIRQMIGNGVPLPMGRAIARAVKAALDTPRSDP